MTKRYDSGSAFAPRRPVRGARGLAFAVISGGAVLFGTGCTRGADQAAASAASTAADVTLTAAQRRHINLVTVARSAYHRTIATTGTVDFDNDQATSVLAPFSGPVARLIVAQGAKVRAGDPLALVESPDFAAAVGAYRKALAAASAARNRADLDEDLLQHHGVSRREEEQAQADALSAEADRDAALAALGALHVDERTLADLRAGRAVSRVDAMIRAPISGTVVEKLISPGELLQAGTTPCFTIADLSRVWVMAQIFGADIAAVGVGDPAEVISGIDARDVPGTVTNVAAEFDPNTRSVIARVAADNPGDLLKKQMYVRVLIHSRHASEGLLVPVSAILRDDDNLPFVYVAEPDGGFGRRHVTLGYRAGDRVRHHRRTAVRRPGRDRRRPVPAIHPESMSEPVLPEMPPPATASIMNRIVASSLRQRFIVALMTLLLIGAGLWSLQRLPMDAYPDLSPPMVEIITQWPGHAAEEVERLITVPVERGMNGVPRTAKIRSISLYGLSDVTLTFLDATDNYFARQRVFNRLAALSLPSGVAPSVSPLSAPSGLIYRYVLQSPDRSPMELKTFEDWTVEPQYRSVPGVADDSGFGGGTMQYQVLLDPARIAAVGLSVAQVEAALAANNTNAGGGFYSQGGQFYYVRGLGRLETLADIGNVVLAVHNGTPVLVKNVGRVVTGIAPRLGEFGYEQQNDAVEGVILMLKGAKTERVLRRVEAKTKQLNEEILPKDVKIHAFYDLSDLIARTTQVVQRNLLRGVLLVVVVLVFFLYDLRAGLIVAATIPLALLFAFVCLDLQNASANLLSIGAVDFGILVDGAIFMVENIFRRIAARGDAPLDVGRTILEAAAEVDRPLFYAVMVIVAGFIPIYVLAGPSGTLFKPMADTMIFALVGSLLITLTLLPVMCSWFMRGGVREKRNPAFEAIGRAYVAGLDYCLARPRATVLASAILLAASLLLVPRIGAEFMPHLDEGALWVRATMPYTISFDEAAKIAPQIRAVLQLLPRGHHGHFRARSARRRHRFDRLLQRRVLRRIETVLRVARPVPGQGGVDRGGQRQARVLSRHHLQLHAASGRRRR